MTLVAEGVNTSLLAALATCGGVEGALFEAAKALSEDKEASLEEVANGLDPQAAETIRKLTKAAIGGQVTAKTILNYFGGIKHYREMGTTLQLSSASVAREIDPQIRAVAHTLLPLTEGRYQNNGTIIDFQGLVPLGPQEGRLFAHLGGVFAIPATDEEVESLIHEQASNPDFMAVASGVGLIDYRNLRLHQSTLAAKKILGLK